MAGAGTSREVHALRSLHDLITTVHSVQDLHEVLQTVAAGVVDVLGFQVAVISCLDAQGDLVVLAAAGDEDACRTMRGSRSPLQEFVDEFELADKWGSLRFLPHDRLPKDASTGWVPHLQPLEVADAWHPLDTLYALLRGPTGEFLGVLNVDLPVDGRRPGPFSRQLLEMYAVQAGLAVHHAQERSRLRQRVRLSNATRTVVETTGRELDLGAALVRSCPPLMEGFVCDWLALEVFAPTAADGTPGSSGPGGHRVAWPGDLVERLGAATSARLSGLAARVARACWSQGRTSIVAEVGDTTQGLLDDAERAVIEEPLRLLGGGTVMLAPLGAARECLGYLVMARTEPDNGRPAAGWTEEECQAALEVGRELGRAVEAARLHQRERQLITELRELDRHKGEMIATITHELKTPLTAIIGYGELLEATGGATRHVSAINRNARRLLKLIDDMLLLTTVKDPHRPFEPTPVDLSALVHEACDMVEVQATRRGVSLDASAVARGDLVPGDAFELARLVGNIVGNAVKFTGSGGRVTLSLSRQGDRVVFGCTDSGIGIAQSDLEALFEEFNRSSNPAAQAVPGTGLGLSIVKRIAERHGGSVLVQSALGEGSTFQVTLPAMGAPTVAERAVTSHVGSMSRP